MARLLVFQHVAAEPLGTLDALIRARGHRTRFVNFDREPDATPSIDRYRGLIVLGGPMNVEDRHALPHLRTELEVIEQALEADKPVLGICLGAQLLAHVLGGEVRHNGASEIGWHDIETTAQGRTDPVLAPLQSLEKVFQWHSYTFEVPTAAELLATGDICRNQAFRYGESAYGFQFHMEMSEALVHRWLEAPRHAAALAAQGDNSRERIREDTKKHLAKMQGVAAEVFNNFLDIVGRPIRHVVHPSR